MTMPYSEQLLDAYVKIAGIFHSIHLIDLSKDSVVTVKTHPFVERYVHDGIGARQMMVDVMTSCTVEVDLERVLEFTDLDTLAERLRDGQTDQLVLKGVNVGYIRIRFVATKKDQEGLPTQVLFMVEVVDDLMRQEEIARKNALTDSLTGLGNRRAYEEDARKLGEGQLGSDFVYVSADANGLKELNDTKGHAAGDEYLKGIAYVLNRCLGGYGMVYRTGGDEFVALIHMGNDKIPRAKADIAEISAVWDGVLINELSIAVGFSAACDNPGLSLRELAAVADKRMYEEKAAYYKNKGIDRRGQHLAYMTLVKSYTKILEASLTTDSYRAIQIDESEREAAYGYGDKLSDWLKNFALTGMVHPDDAEEFLREMDFDHLRQHFRKGSTAFALRYRRMIGGKYRHALLEIVPTKSYTDEDQNVYILVKKIDA